MALVGTAHISCLISNVVRGLVQVLMTFLMRRVMSLLMTLVGWVRYRLEQLLIAVRASAVLRRAGTGAGQAFRLRCTALRRLFILNHYLVSPTVAKVVKVLGVSSFLQQLVQPIVLLIDR